MVPADISFYKKRVNDFYEKSLKSKQKAKYISFFRLITFIGFLVISVIAANRGDLIMLSVSVILFLLFFIFLVNKHHQVNYSFKHYGYLSAINEEEILRIEGKFDSFEGGLSFIDQHHNYHVDLDIYGQNSLFQLLNRTTTYWGRNVLASWLSAPASYEEILARQDAVIELASDIDWSQELQAKGRHHEDHADMRIFLNWLQKEPLILGNRFLEVIRYTGPFLTLILAILFFSSVISWEWPVLSILLQSFIIPITSQRIKIIHESTAASIKSLQSFEALIELVEKKDFRAVRLQEIRSIFLLEEGTASRIIGRLKRILQGLDNRANQIYQLVNFILLLDLHYAIAAEKWKKRQPENTKKWFQKLGEMEALNSLAGYHYANPHYSFPEISREAFLFETGNIGHPMIPYSHRVYNNYEHGGKGTIAIITGSNMAGKTTFLRTIGVNTVLALMGGPVCADYMKISNFRVFTSMRNQDNLEENISSFYAELKRFRQLFDHINRHGPLLFLLDEILKGTNSNDRHLGAVSLVKQLSEKYAMGLISTHDLELAKSSVKDPGIVNYSFESSIEGDEILFDYKLRPGICATFNASKLMEKMGIKLVK
jgi:ABC-type Na+ transport system ATPase subunit NatA